MILPYTHDPLAFRARERALAPTQDNFIDLTDDGRWLAYGTQASDEDGYGPTMRGIWTVVASSRLWVLDRRTGAKRCLTTRPGTSSWGARWSPDGGRLAYFSDEGGPLCLHVWERATGRDRAFPAAKVRSLWAMDTPLWAPDGKRVFYTALWAGVPPRRVYPAGEGTAIDVRTTSPEPRPNFWFPNDLVVTDLASGAVRRLFHGNAIQTFGVSPDGKRALVLNGQWLKDPTEVVNSGALWLLDVAAPKPFRVGATEGMRALQKFLQWSPDGKGVAFSAGDGVYRVDVAARRLTTVFDPSRLTPEDRAVGRRARRSYMLAPLWTPDSKTLVWCGEGRVFRANPDGSGLTRLGLKPLVFPEGASGPPRPITVPLVETAKGEGATKPPILLAPAPEEGPPGEPVYSTILRPSREATAYVEGGRILVYTVEPGGGEGMAAMRLADGDVRPIVRREQTYWTAGFNEMFYRDVARGTGEIVYAAYEGIRFAGWWAADRGFARRRLLDPVNPKRVRTVYGMSRHLEYALADGTKVAADLLVPFTAPWSKAPTIVVPYMGKQAIGSTDGLVHGDDAPGGETTLIFLNHGFAVLIPDTVVVTGDQLASAARSVLPAMDAAVATGLVAPNRFGLYGHSYGGYQANALLTTTDRFKAAVVSAGIADLCDMFLFSDGDTSYTENGQGAVGATLWEAPDKYVLNSPIYHLDRVRTPAMFVSGMDDAYAVEQSRKMFNGLQRLGRTATWLRVKDGSHGWWTFPPAAQRDFWRRALAWYDRYLLP